MSEESLHYNTNDLQSNKRQKLISHVDKDSPTKLMDATTFLFKSPSNTLEIEKFTVILEEFLDKIVRSYQEQTSDDRNNFRLDAQDIQGYDDTDEEKTQMQNSMNEPDLLDYSAAIVRGNPRSYQTALFELAKVQNTIVNLPTGAGKTLVALLCIKHFASGFHDSAVLDSTPVECKSIQIKDVTPLDSTILDDVERLTDVSHVPILKRTGKQTLFLVPSIALAIQHTATLRANLPFTVRTACSVMVRSSRARDELYKANIIVATHGAARNLFMHYGDMFSLKHVNLIVVDECHYAIGDHGYAGLFKNFYHTIESIEDRPRVLGLTASPLVNIRKDVDDEKLEMLLQELEVTLDAKLAGISTQLDTQRRMEDESTADEQKGGKQFTSQAIERVIHYHAHKPGSTYPNLPPFDNIGLHTSRIKEFNLLYDLYASLGPKITAIYSKTLSIEVSRNRYDEETAEEFILVRKHLLTITTICEELCRKDEDGGRTEKLATLEQILENEVEYNGLDSVGVVFVDRRITALALHNYFKERERALDQGLPWLPVADTRWNRMPKNTLSSNFINNDIDACFDGQSAFECGTFLAGFTDDQIQHIDDKMICQILADTLPEGINITDFLKDEEDISNGTPEVQTYKRYKTIHSDMLVRQSNQIFKYLDKRYHYTLEEEDMLHEDWLHEMKRCVEVLDGLRSRRTNVLIATSVVEEGVDVEACSFVIVFDSLKSTKGYVQMRGRARQKNARFYVFHDTSPICMASHITLQDAFYIDRRLQQFIEQRPANVPVSRPLARVRFFDKFSCDEYKAIKEGFYSVGLGTVDLTSARSLLNRYALGIPSEVCSNSRESFMMKLPVFEENTLTLSSHLPGDVRQVYLPGEFHGCNKRDKMNMMALMACVRLHKLKLLNDRLLPLQRKDISKTLLNLTMSAIDLKVAPPATVRLDAEQDLHVFIYGLDLKGETFNEYDILLKSDGRKLCIISTKRMPSSSLKMSITHPEMGLIKCQLLHPTEEELTPTQWSDLVSFYMFAMNARYTKRDGSTFFKYNVTMEDSVIHPYVIGCLTKDGFLDWQRMEACVHGYSRSIDERVEAARNYNPDAELEEPRICCTKYDRFSSYVILGGSNLTSSAPFPSKIAGCETYYQYMAQIRNFDVDRHGRLFYGQRLWYLPRRCSHEFPDESPFEEYEVSSVDKSLDTSATGTVMLPQDAIMETTFADASLFLHLVILPQFLFLTDHRLTVLAFIDYASCNFPILGRCLQQLGENSLDSIKEAMTARNCGFNFNYDKLEWLGDAVIKLIHTDALLSSSILREWVKYLHEGDLTMLRSALGSNETLAKAAKNANIDRFIYTKQLARGHWSPNCLDLFVVEENRVTKSSEAVARKKMCADVIESLMGLIYTKFGFVVANDVAMELGISIEKGTYADKSIPGYVPDKRFLALAKSALNMNEFKTVELIEEALTHPSCIHEQVPSYQNLEWIGDAVLCLFIRNWVYKQFPNFDVSALNLIEASLICNETLAYISLNHGLHRYINHRDSSLPSRIEVVERALSSKGRGLWTTDPPKSISDVVESLLGASHVDSGFEAGQRAAHHMMTPVLVAISTDNTGVDSATVRHRMMHPKQSLHETASFIQIKAYTEDTFASQKISCPIWRDHYWGSSVRDGPGYLAVIRAFGVDIAAVHDASAHVARNRACAICFQVFNEPLKDLLNEVKSLLRKRMPEEDEDK